MIVPKRYEDVVTEIVALVGDDDIPLEVSTLTGNLTFTPDSLLRLVKSARKSALDEFEGTGGRFGPAPS